MTDDYVVASLGRLRRVARGAGLAAPDADLIAAWEAHSDDVFAGWAELPGDDHALLRIIRRALAHIEVDRRFDAIEAAERRGDGSSA